MVSVLFVDDDIVSLRALHQTYAGGDEEWETRFVLGADAALETLSDQPIDAVVANARLSGMSTPRFLGLTKQQYPRTARIALSAPGDRSAMLSTLPFVNQCLSKACGIDVLAKVVAHTTRLQAKLFSEATMRMVAEIGSLPSLPSSLMALDAALSDEDCSLGEIADILSGDVAMVAKVLHLVNSSSFGLRTEIHDLRQAVTYLGVETLRDFAMAGAAFRAFVPSPALPSGWLATFNAHSMAVADMTSNLVLTSPAQCEANVAGILHDVGELVVAERAPAKLISIAGEVSAGSSPDDAEVRHIGTTFPVIAGHLLSLWGMGYPIVEAITAQRDAWAGPARSTELGDVVRVADYLVSGRLSGQSDDHGSVGADGIDVSAAGALVCQSSRTTDIDEDYQARVGLLAAVRMYNQAQAQRR